MVDQEQHALTISEVAVDWQEPMVLQCKWCHPLPALVDIGPVVAASKHTTAPLNHTRPSPRKHSLDVTTPSEMAEPNYCLLLIYRPRKDERLSCPSWLSCSRWLTQQLQVEHRTGKFGVERSMFYHCFTQPTCCDHANVVCHSCRQRRTIIKAVRYSRVT